MLGFDLSRRARGDRRGQRAGARVGVHAAVGARRGGSRSRLPRLAVAEARPNEATAETTPTYRLTVTPTALPANHPLAHLQSDEMGIVYYSDIYGRTVVTSQEEGPLGTCAAMLRDIIEIVTTYD